MVTLWGVRKLLKIDQRGLSLNFGFWGYFWILGVFGILGVFLDFGGLFWILGKFFGIRVVTLWGGVRKQKEIDQRPLSQKFGFWGLLDFLF